MPIIICMPDSSLSGKRLEEALVDVSWRDATISNDLSLGLRHQQDDKDQICSGHDDQKPKDPSPAELLGKHAGDDRTEARGGVGTTKNTFISAQTDMLTS